MIVLLFSKFCTQTRKYKTLNHLISQIYKLNSPTFKTNLTKSHLFIKSSNQQEKCIYTYIHPELPSSRTKMKGLKNRTAVAPTNSPTLQRHLHQCNCPHQMCLFFRKIRDNCEVSKFSVFPSTLRFFKVD